MDNSQRPPYQNPYAPQPGQAPAPFPGQGQAPAAAPAVSQFNAGAGYAPAPGFAQQPGGSFGAPQQRWAPGQVAPGSTAPTVGDAAMEHYRMQRGRYSAWMYVVMGFLYEIAFLGLVPGIAGVAIGSAAGMRSGDAGMVGLVAGGVVGIVGSFFVFRDRWRVNEAFCSRYCAGIVNISMLYVPFIALVYANVRGVQKLFGK